MYFVRVFHIRTIFVESFRKVYMLKQIVSSDGSGIETQPKWLVQMWKQNMWISI